MCVNIYIYIYIYTYTHIHTYIHTLEYMQDDEEDASESIKIDAIARRMKATVDLLDTTYIYAYIHTH